MAAPCVPVDGPTCALVDVFLGGLNVDALAGAVAGALDLAWAVAALPLAGAEGVADDLAWGQEVHLLQVATSQNM